MSKLQVKLNRVSADLFRTPKGIQKFEDLKNEIINNIDVSDTKTMLEVKDMIKGWKALSDAVLTPFDIAKKESHKLYKDDMQKLKDATQHMDSIKDELVKKFNEYILPIKKAEEEKASKEYAERVAAAEKALEEERKIALKELENSKSEEQKILIEEQITNIPTNVVIKKYKEESSIDTSGLRKQPDKYEVFIINIDLIEDEYITKTINERKIIEDFKSGIKDIKGINVVVTEGQYK